MIISKHSHFNDHTHAHASKCSFNQICTLTKAKKCRIYKCVLLVKSEVNSQCIAEFAARIDNVSNKEFGDKCYNLVVKIAGQ